MPQILDPVLAEAMRTTYTARWAEVRVFNINDILLLTMPWSGTFTATGKYVGSISGTGAVSGAPAYVIIYDSLGTPLIKADDLFVFDAPIVAGVLTRFNQGQLT